MTYKSQKENSIEGIGNEVVQDDHGQFGQAF